MFTICHPTADQMVTVMNERQKKAQDLARELEQMGAWVVTPLPLDDDTRGLRVQILDTERDKVITELCAAGWVPAFLQGHPRFTPNGLIPASLFEIVIEKERQLVSDDRPKVSNEIAELAKREEKRKADATIAAFKKHIGWDK
jgi:hypothetical protein